MNRAAPIFAKNIRRRKAKPCVTTTISPMCSRGNSRVTDKSRHRNYIASRFTSKPFTWLKGVTNELPLKSLAAVERESGRQARRLRCARHSGASLASRNARHRERTTRSKRQRSDRVRFRLSRRNLWNLFAHRQRRSARPGSSRRSVRTLHAQISRWGDDRDRAVSGEKFSDHQRFGS